MDVKKQPDELTRKEEKIPFPKSSLFILGTEFCERYCFLSIRLILSLYLVDQLLYSENEATIVYHVFSMFSYFFPIFGSMLSDSWLGDFRTIFYFSLLYAVGSVVISLSAIGPLNLPSRTFAILGLLLVAIGSGCIKPSIMSFGGDQFVLPQQLVQLGEFYSFFYVAISAANFISSGVTPVLREHVHCFQEDQCFSLAFGTPSVVMLIALTVFLTGKRFYKLRPQEGNLLIRVFKCIWTALVTRTKSKEPPKAHWLDYAGEKYGKALVDDIKLVLRVLVMFLPIPLYWALNEQVGTTALFMARRMDGYIGFYTILPEQISFIDSIIYLALIPVFQYAVYPPLTRCGLLRTPLRKITAAGVFMSSSFVIYGCISLLLEATYPVLPSSGEAQIRIYNTLPCDIKITSVNSTSEISIARGDYYKNTELKVEGNGTILYKIRSSCRNASGEFRIYEGATVGYFFKELSEEAVFFEDTIEKNSKGYPLVRTLVNLNNLQDTPVQITYTNSKGSLELETSSNDTRTNAIKPDTYTLAIGNSTFEQKFALGGVYSMLAIGTSKTSFDVDVVEVTPPNNIHMLWLIPQGVVMSMGYIMYSIPGIEFVYSQAPSSMKTIIMAGWLLTLAAGNLIVVLIQAIVTFEKASYNFFLYSGLMLADTMIFFVLAVRYKYVNVEDVKSDKTSDE